MNSAVQGKVESEDNKPPENEVKLCITCGRAPATTTEGECSFCDGNSRR